MKSMVFKKVGLQIVTALSLLFVVGCSSSDKPSASVIEDALEKRIMNEARSDENAKVNASVSGLKCEATQEEGRYKCTATVAMDIERTRNGNKESASAKKENVEIHVNKANGEWFVNRVSGLF